METKRVFWAMWVIVCGCFISQISWAKSVYVIANTNDGTIQAYTVGNNELIFQKERPFGGLAIGLAVDDSLVGTFLFVTYEGQSFIRVIDAKSMTLIDDVYLPHAANLAGIVYDSERNKVYVVDRLSNHLYSYSWNSRELSLQPDFDDPYYLELEEIEVGTNSGAIGLALDMTNDRLYISDVTNEVKYYNVNDWSYGGSISLSESAIGIAIDPTRELLLYGNMGYTYNNGLDSIGRYDLAVSDPNLAETFEYTGAAVGGIAFDPETGYVFTTLFGSQDETVYPASAPQDSVQMFCPYDPNDPPDPNLTIVWDSPDIGNPSGIVFSNEDYKPSGISIEKSDNLSACAEPENFVTYTIAVHSKAYEQTNVVVTDILPYETDFVSADPNTGTYYPEDHVYVWDIPTLADPNTISGDPNVYLSLTVQINYGSEPSGQMVNKVIAESDTSYDTGQAYTDICCWGGDVIYVDKDARWERVYMGGQISASGYNSGTSWENAYRDLNDALARAAKGCGSEIWVAKGTYRPGPSATDTFLIPAGVKIYGGFSGNETSRGDRNNQRYKKTILNGYVGTFYDGWGEYYDVYNNTVVKPGDGSLLDGVTVEEGKIYGIYGSGKSFSLSNCIIHKNNQTGIYCLNGNLTVQWCEIAGNGWRGIHHYGNGTLTVENCKIHDNYFDGIATQYSASQIINSVIYQNGSGNDYYGIYIESPPACPTIRNNTIVQNVNEGIRFVGSHAPDIVNCIIYYNGGDSPLKGLNPDAVAYNCCIADCNEVNSNFNDAPGFAYTTEPNNLPVVGNYHLAWNSPCVDTGDSDEYTDEVDIDGEPRMYGTLVDRGADEAYSCDSDLSEDDVYNALDWNADGLVNLYEFNFFSRAWLSVSPTDPNYNSVCDLDSDLDVDLGDLMIFANDWLWMACWRTDLLELQLQQPPTEPTPPASPPAEPNTPPVEPPAEPPAEPNVVFKIQDANELQEITLNTGDSIRLYLAKQTFEEDVFVIWLEVNVSDPNFGWLDNTEYNPNDPNNSATAQILASPRDEYFDYYGPGYTQFEGIQFIAASLGGAIQDGSLASFVYTATQPGDVLLTLVNYDDFIPARLEQIVIHQTEAGSYSSQMGTSALNSLMEMDAAAETENILSLLEDIDTLIDAGGDDAEAWQEIKILLQQSLMETEDTVQIE